MIRTSPPRVAAAVILASLLVNTAALMPGHDVRANPPVFVPDPPAPPAMPPEVVDEEGDQQAAVTGDSTPNHVDQLSEKQKNDLEVAAEVTVVDNTDGLIAFDTRDDAGNLVRVALFDAHTTSGLDVVGIAFLDESAIAELESMRAGESGSSRLLAPSVVSAHKTTYNHYHFFWKCSYAYQYANSWNVYVHVCPTDAGLVKGVGTALGAAIGAVLTKNVFGAALGGIVVHIGLWYFSEPDGSINFYVPGDAIERAYGWVYYYGRWQSWTYFYPNWHDLYCYAYRSSNGLFYWWC